MTGPVQRGDLLLNLLRATDLRQRVIATNLANQETPGYTRQLVRFEDLLTNRLEHGGADLTDIVPSVVEDRLTPAGPDGNNVTLELEMASARQNRMLQDIYTTLLQSRFNLLRTAIDGGRG